MHLNQKKLNGFGAFVLYPRQKCHPCLKIPLTLRFFHLLHLFWRFLFSTKQCCDVFYHNSHVFGLRRDRFAIFPKSPCMFACPFSGLLLHCDYTPAFLLSYTMQKIESPPIFAFLVCWGLQPGKKIHGYSAQVSLAFFNCNMFSYQLLINSTQRHTNKHK